MSYSKGRIRASVLFALLVISSFGYIFLYFQTELIVPDPEFKNPAGLLPFQYSHVRGSKGPSGSRQSMSESSLIISPWVTHLETVSNPEKFYSEIQRPPPLPPLPLILAVTPTYPRPMQAPHMNQMANVLRSVAAPLLWIVVESLHISEETSSLLNRTAAPCLPHNSPSCTSISYVHLATEKQHEVRGASRGVGQRNCALDYIQRHRLQGIVYFMDDDNVYSLPLFDEIRKVQRVGVFPVGFVSSREAQRLRLSWHLKPFVERPLVKRLRGEKGVVYGWETFQWALRTPPMARRKYHLDMAGFAFKYLETLFIEKLISSATELEPLADNCRDVFVWHIHFESNRSDPYPINWRLEQPTKLMPDPAGASRAPYLVGKVRHMLKGKLSDQLTLPGGYRSAA